MKKEILKKIIKEVIEELFESENVFLKNLGNESSRKVVVKGINLYFSYETLVAVYKNGEKELYITNQKYSKTTNNFISKLKSEYQQLNFNKIKIIELSPQELQRKVTELI